MRAQAAWPAWLISPDFELDASAGAFRDSNLNRASDGADVRSDNAAAASVAAGWLVTLPSGDGLTLTTSLRGEEHDHYTGLDQVALGIDLALRHKFAVGWAAPKLVVDVSAGADRYRADIRDSDRLGLNAELGKRFTQRLDAATGVVLDRRYALNSRPDQPGIPGKTFDLHGTSAYLRGGYELTDALLLDLRGSVRHGLVVSTAHETDQSIAAASAIAQDPAFRDPELYAYRLTGTTTSLATSLSWALNGHAAVNLRYVIERTAANAGFDYRSHILSADLAYRY